MPLSDAELLAEDRPAAELRRALKARTVCRIAYLRGLGRYARMDEALDAIAAADARRACAVTVQEAKVREDLAEVLERVVPRHVTVADDQGEIDAEGSLHPTDAREAARDVLGHLSARGYVVRRAAA